MEHEYGTSVTSGLSGEIPATRQQRPLAPSPHSPGVSTVQSSRSISIKSTAWQPAHRRHACSKHNHNEQCNASMSIVTRRL